MSGSQKKKVETAINQAVAFCELRGVWRRFAIREMDSGEIKFGDNQVFESVKLAEMLKESSSLVLFAVSAGADVVSKTSKAADDGDGVTALVYDAVGSEMTDAAAAWMQQYLNQQFKRSKEILTKRRFSPGYGDLELKNQAILFKLLDLEKLGIKLTDDFLMVPEKTVTAIAGIEKIS
jgi:cobalamin-dependent methionine synthase I